MKNKILTGLALILAVSWLFTSCESDMEKAQKDYDASKVIPMVLGVSGPSIGLQTFTYTYNVTYFRAGSTWNWTAEGATVQSVSADTRTATIKFTNIPASDTALIKVSETTEGGVTSPERIIKTRVNPYCALTNGVADLVGTWSGDDGWYESLITTVANGTTGLKVSHLNEGFISDWWGETIIEGGTINMTVNINGTVEIPRQYIFTTTWSGSPYRYEIDGSGTWDNCGANPAMLIEYSVYYEGENECYIAGYYPSDLDAPFFTADISLATKSGKSARQPLKPATRK